MAFQDTTALRASFARQLSALYGTEVPAYNTLVDVSTAVNADAMKHAGADAERLGSIARVTAERHGAIRVGSPKELAQVSRVFAGFGMFPTGFYDLREAAGSSIPVVSTAFRPLDREALALNPFRVFCSMLVPEDRRFFSEDLQARLDAFLAARELFPPRLLELSDAAEAGAGLEAHLAEEYLGLAVAAFKISEDPVDAEWYRELEHISAVAADIGGVTTTHINHLTPRVLDIDDLYVRMEAQGIEMIPAIQGPPRWDGPDVLLRQTSFRALDETRVFRQADGTLAEGTLRVRFGEVEARGIAPTPAGRTAYEQAMARIQTEVDSQDRLERNELAASIWADFFPKTEAKLLEEDLAYFEFAVVDDLPQGDAPGTLRELLDGGWITQSPIVYEDFLPRSAAGIFASNLTSAGEKDVEQQSAYYDRAVLSSLIHRDIADPDEMYAKQREESILQVLSELRLESVETPFGVINAKGNL